ncbi:ATP-binding protein [Streptomyces sp. NPDC090445]|uniref:ATP-binding protein n=1 Tax=Streptomyces sp. NPDC090445 TaxID=3365963 RepID=UPI0037F717DD
MPVGGRPASTRPRRCYRVRPWLRWRACCPGVRRLHAGESVILFGPVGLGKTHIAQALGHLALCQGAHVRFAKTSRILADLAGGHADRTWEKRIRETRPPRRPHPRRPHPRRLRHAPTQRHPGRRPLRSIREVSQKYLAQHAGFERTFANSDLRKRDHFGGSRRTLTDEHL